MNRPSPIRCGIAIAGMLLGGAAALRARAQSTGGAQAAAPVSTLPPAEPTGQAAPTASEQTKSASAAPHYVQVDYADGVLAIQATNASLNEILREVGQKTGMKITGGVADDRVFGSYGPSTPALVLDALLDGTGSNMLLVADDKGGSELILTPRHGGATPPNPNAGRQANEAEENVGGSYVPPVRPYQPPSAGGRAPGGFGPDAAGSNPGYGTGSDPSGGNKTPQEIYDQLQQTMQQQRRLGSGGAPPQ